MLQPHETETPKVIAVPPEAQKCHWELCHRHKEYKPRGERWCWKCIAAECIKASALWNR